MVYYDKSKWPIRVSRGVEYGDSLGGAWPRPGDIEALALDYDQTVSQPMGILLDRVAAGVNRFVAEAGLRLFIVSGRPLDYLLDVSRRLTADGLVAENGNIIYSEGGGKEFLEDGRYIVELFRGCGFEIQLKESIVEFSETFWHQALKILRQAGRPYRYEFNNHQIMVMPEGVFKLRGLRVLLRRFHLTLDHTIFVGDGENDVEVMEKSSYSVAVANAPEVVKKHADYVTRKRYGDGILEFLDLLRDAWSLG